MVFATIKMDKKYIRSTMLRRRNSLSREEVIDLSCKIEINLFSWKNFLSCDHILYYRSFGNEVMTDTMITRSLDLRKKVYVPRILKREGKLEICEIENLEKKFVLNSLGMREPHGINVKTVSPVKIDAVVTPGLAFDRSGSRIGFGGGYYDKLFVELPNQSLRIGVAYDFQRVESLYQDPWDKKVHKVITEKTR
jgi:5-formyltetrahydrofolate cyclo-ligase